jgi:glucosyl-3-phosphoglycerate synthase
LTRLRVVALLPAFNEAGRIGSAVKALLAAERVSEIVVVADGSTDRTAEEANRAGARVLISSTRRGKGGALEEAIDRIPRADAYLLVDGDVAETAREAEALLDPVLAGELDLAIGNLPPQEGAGFGMVRRLAGRLISRATGFEAEEPLSGQRAVAREALDACRPLSGGFGVEVAMTIDALRLGLRVREVPVAMSHRPTGRTVSGFAHRARQGLDIVRAALPRVLGLR